MTTQPQALASAQRYHLVSIIFHWLIALAFLANIALGLAFDYVGDANIRLAIDSHKSLGVLVLVLVAMRIVWRFYCPPPKLPNDMPSLHKNGVHLAHIGLYILMIGLPLSGWLHDSAWKAAKDFPMHWFGLFEWPRIAWIANMEAGAKESFHSLSGDIHHYLAYVFYGLFALHVVAAVKHQISRSELGRRGMLG